MHSKIDHESEGTQGAKATPNDGVGKVGTQIYKPTHVSKYKCT